MNCLIIIQIGISLIIVALQIFFRNYFSKKGENSATKEDIGEITRLQEKARAEITRDLDLMKNTLLLKNEHLLSMRSAEREALIDYFKAINILVNKIVEYDPEVMAKEADKRLSSIYENIRSEQAQVYAADGILSLYYRTDNLNTHHCELRFSIIELTGHVAIYTIKFREQYQLISNANQYHQPVNEIYDTIKGLLGEFLDKRNLIYAKILNYKKMIRDIIIHRLQELSELE